MYRLYCCVVAKIELNWDTAVADSTTPASCISIQTRLEQQAFLGLQDSSPNMATTVQKIKEIEAEMVRDVLFIRPRFN